MQSNAHWREKFKLVTHITKFLIALMQDRDLGVILDCSVKTAAECAGVFILKKKGKYEDMYAMKWRIIWKIL